MMRHIDYDSRMLRQCVSND